MLTPTELKSKQFSKSIFGGYSMEEVDRFLDLVTPDYEALYSENAELTKKVEILIVRLEASQEQEESIKAAIINAQKMCDSIIREAQQSGELIIKSAKNQAEKIRERADDSIKDKTAQFESIKHEVDSFKSELVEAYRSHLQKINAIPSVSIGNLEGPEELTGNTQEEEAVQIGEHSMETRQGTREEPPEEQQEEAINVEQFKVTLPEEISRTLEEEKRAQQRFTYDEDIEDKTPTGEFNIEKTIVFETPVAPEDVKEYKRVFGNEPPTPMDIITKKEDPKILIEEDYNPEYDTNADVLKKQFSASLQFGEDFARAGEKPKVKQKGRLFRQ